MNELRKTILIVDDAPENLDIQSELLKNRYKIKAAISGERALKIISKKLPDLILLDILMPEMDGYQFFKILKADVVTQNIPIILVTAKTSVANQKKGIELGADGYLNKPVDSIKLLEMVGEVLC